MTRRRGTKTTEWEADHQHALRVACPLPPLGCAQPPGGVCVNRRGHPLDGPPSHPARGRLADETHPENARPPALPPPPERPTGRRLIAADRIPRALGEHREACRHCHTAIVWASTDRGDRVPIDADPHPEGRWWLTVEPDHVRAVKLPAGRAAGARAHGRRLHRAHRQTCPRALLWSHHANP